MSEKKMPNNIIKTRLMGFFNCSAPLDA